MLCAIQLYYFCVANNLLLLNCILRFSGSITYRVYVHSVQGTMQHCQYLAIGVLVRLALPPPLHALCTNNPPPE